LKKRPPQDTSLGGEGDRFPETTGEIRSLLGNPGPLAELLCRRYWKPVYAYVRIAWSKTNDDAKDLTQAFFLWLMEGETLRKYDAERGGFRAYLKVLLKRFVGHEERALKALKRGGDVHRVSLDGELPVLRDLAAADADSVFEKVWLDQILRGAIDRVRERCASTGKEVRFQVYQAFTVPQKSDRPSYKELAARFGLKVSDVENYLFAIREAIRAEVRSALLQVTSSPQEFEDEWKRLFGG
jgi:DNA-directed RNA polymerase specialized sigma24 family protein